MTIRICNRCTLIYNLDKHNSCPHCKKVKDAMIAPIRVQFTLYNKLQAEVIVQNYDTAVEVQSKFFRAKYRKNLEFGGSLAQLAGLPRYWDVPVGSVIS